MIEELDENFFYFVGGYTRVYTGLEVKSLYKLNRVSYGNWAKITNCVELILFFKGKIFSKETKAFVNKNCFSIPNCICSPSIINTLVIPK